jgi:hypothetical protein
MATEGKQKNRGKRGSHIYCGLIAVVILLIIISLGAGCRKIEPAKDKYNDSKHTELVIPTHGAYCGAYVDFGEGEREVTYDALLSFERMTGKHQAIVAFGNFWGDQVFPQKTLQIISSYGAVPLIFWSPWDKPYQESKGPDRFSLESIVAGKWDAYIEQWADAARSYDRPMLVAWGLEMNGAWFPWSGCYYGKDQVTVDPTGQKLFKSQELFKRAYRHVVDKVKAKGADNILWGFHANNFTVPLKPWNSMAGYYPGKDYVDWLGLSVYGQMGREDDWSSFHDAMETGYNEICQLDPDKPVFVAEWGVGEFPPADKAGFISQAFLDMKDRYKRVRAAVYWHERWENGDGSFSNLHVNSSPEALDAYRDGLANPYWLDKPQLHKRRNHSK